MLSWSGDLKSCGAPELKVLVMAGIKFPVCSRCNFERHWSKRRTNFCQISLTGWRPPTLLEIAWRQIRHDRQPKQVVPYKSTHHTSFPIYKSRDIWKESFSVGYLLVEYLYLCACEEFALHYFEYICFSNIYLCFWYLVQFSAKSYSELFAKFFFVLILAYFKNTSKFL